MDFMVFYVYVIIYLYNIFWHWVVLNQYRNITEGRKIAFMFELLQHCFIICSFQIKPQDPFSLT